MLQTHQRLGEFEIIRILGQGGMGEVYEAQQDRPHRRVALKVLAPWLAGNEQFLQGVAPFLAGQRVCGDSQPRADVSYHRTSGYVDDAGSNSFNATGALLYKPSENFSVELSVDYLRDNLSTYFGTPLVPGSFAADPIKGILRTSNG